MNDNYDIRRDGGNMYAFKKVTGRYDTDTLVDIPLTPNNSDKWKKKLYDIRDKLVEGTLMSSEYTPIASKNIRKNKPRSGKCDNCIIC